jgi:tRNA G18 (ribose-2'-O)-methylase SpoU
MHYPNNLGAIARSIYILGFYGVLCDRRLFVSRPTNKRRSKKMACTRSAFSINPTTYKMSIGKTNKIKRRRS